MKDWLKRMLSGKPHFVIGGWDDPYMLRWYLIPRNRRFNLYLHKFLRDDVDEALHDHPWWFVSIILKGGYDEITLDEPPFRKEGVRRYAPSVAFRRAEHRHRVVLPKRTSYADDTRREIPIPCWTIVLTGPVSRSWGFWCPKGFVPWKQFVAEDDNGNIGRGCGEMS